MVAGLKAAGAVILGKTTTTEFGWKSPGDCPLHGITRNPWNPAYTTGGSSSGAGAAGAAGFGPLHIGTDAGGSVRIPAAWCGLVGLKPTYGRIPQWPASAFASVAVRRPDDPHRPRRRADVRRHGALGPARSVLPAGRSPRLARRHRGRRRRPDRRRAEQPRLRRAGRCRRHRRGGTRRPAAGRCRRLRGTGRRRPARHQPASSAASGAPPWPAWSPTRPRNWSDLLDPGIREVARDPGRHDRDRVHGRRGHPRRRRPRHGSAASALRPGAVPDRARRAAAGRCADRRSGPRAVDGLGAVDLHLQPDPPAGDLRADGPASRRAAELGADRRRAVPRRPGAARRPGDRDWRSRSRWPNWGSVDRHRQGSASSHRCKWGPRYMANADPAFTGSVPELYTQYMGPSQCWITPVPSRDCHCEER